MALVSFLLCAASLLIIRASVRREITQQTSEAVDSAVRAFNRFQHEQDSELLRTASLLSELPPLKAVMTAPDPLTVQDASTEFWNLSATDILVLADPEGRVIAVHSEESALNVSSAQAALKKSLNNQEQIGWWQSSDHLYRIAIRSITAGSGKDERVLGELILGMKIDDSMAEDIRRFSGNEITLLSGISVVASTIHVNHRAPLTALIEQEQIPSTAPRRIVIDQHPYEAATVALQTTPATPIRCLILFPLDSSEAFLTKLNWTVAVLGIVIGLLGTAIMLLISHAITRPLESLVKAVNAMASGDDTYDISAPGTAEIKQLSTAFDQMRSEIAESRRKQLEAERLAALGRAAGSISHDLRHILAALVANAEFLRDAEEIGCDRDEVYEELQRASAQMTELIDSLIEVAREGQQVRLAHCSFDDIISQAVTWIRSKPEFRGRRLEVNTVGDTGGFFEAPRLERALFNLLLNSCDAIHPITGRIHVAIGSDHDFIDCSITDNGPGLPEEVREKLFQPFVTAGKPNGTGLGLAIASKIIQEHGGELRLLHTSSAGTSFFLRIPRWKAMRIDQRPGRDAVSPGIYKER